ncbi:MAG: putative mobilization protein MobD [Verrucomicrobiales bacterium]|nr:putative mobilization protein MobD [Verrucomicrobiales bacterium]
MANIHLIGGEKGGVGKSMVARLLAQYLIDKELPFLGFDTDRSHGALMRFYSGYASPVLVDRYENLDTIIEAAVAEPDRRILVDLAAQTHDPLMKWMTESEVLNLGDEVGFSIYYWHVMDSSKDSVDLLKRLMDRFDARLKYVLVFNHIRGDDFQILKQSGERARAESLGARSISLKRLHDTVVTKIDATSSSFWAAKNASDKETAGLGLMDRQRLKGWLRDAYQQFDSLAV